MRIRVAARFYFAGIVLMGVWLRKNGRLNGALQLFLRLGGGKSP